MYLDLQMLSYQRLYLDLLESLDCSNLQLLYKDSTQTYKPSKALVAIIRFIFLAPIHTRNNDSGRTRAPMFPRESNKFLQHCDCLQQLGIAGDDESPAPNWIINYIIEGVPSCGLRDAVAPRINTYRHDYQRHWRRRNIKALLPATVRRT